jgi:hypothetical protein
MEALKSGIGLRGYAQVDPKNEYKKEGFELFRSLKQSIADHVTNLVFRVELRAAQAAPQPQQRRRMAMPQLPRDPVVAQAIIDAMIAAGQAPPEVMAAVARGAKVKFKGPGQPLVIEGDPAPPGADAATPDQGASPKRS